MEGKDGRRSSSDESISGGDPKPDAADQTNMLEEEIKKIISDLDIKYEDSPVEEDPGRVGTAGSRIVVPKIEYPPDHQERIETPQQRAESASTVSNATTVVHQRVPPKISVSHLKSERYEWPPNVQGIRLPESPRQQGIPMNNRGYYGALDQARTGLEQGFYQPERDEITEPTTTDTVRSTPENSSTSYAPSTSHQQSRPNQQRTFLPPVPEDYGLRDFQEVGQTNTPYHQYKPPPYGNMQTGGHATMPAFNRVDNQARYTNPPNFPHMDQYHREQEYHQGQQFQPQQFQDQNPYPMQEDVNRYNNTHMTYTPVKEPERPGRRSFTDYLVSKSRSFFNRDSDSGEVIPQLYKARVKNGTAPPKFTFKAVAGIPPPHVDEPLAPHRSYPAPQHDIPVVRSCDRVCYSQPGACEPTCEPINPYCCSYEFPRRYQCNTGCENNNCEIVSMAQNKGIKTKAYADFGCGYISQASVPEKVDIYCFDQLNTGFFRTSDHPPPLFADIAVQRTEKFATVFWAETFGVVNVGTAFMIAGILQTFKFLLQGVVRPLMIGSVQLFSDYFLKPLLTLLYNGFTQPISIFLYNVIASIRDIMCPVAKGLGYFFDLIACVLKAIRLVEVKNVTNITPCTPHSVRYC